MRIVDVYLIKFAGPFDSSTVILGFRYAKQTVGNRIQPADENAGDDFKSPIALQSRTTTATKMVIFQVHALINAASSIAVMR